MADAHTYTGSCHCGKVRYEVTMTPGKVISCNCSICIRRGALLAFVPAAQFKLLAGEEGLTDYQFGRQNIHHLFCATCGVASFARGTGPSGAPMCAVNTRCLEGVDLGTFEVVPFDGKSL